MIAHGIEYPFGQLSCYISSQPLFHPQPTSLWGGVIGETALMCKHCSATFKTLVC